MPRTDEVVRGFLFIRNGQRCPALKQLISLRSIKTARGAPLPVFSQAKSLAGQETGCKKKRSAVSINSRRDLVWNPFFSGCVPFRHRGMANADKH